MLPLAASVLEKVDHAIERIQAVKGSSLALSDTAAALDALAEKLASYKETLVRLTESADDSDAVSNYCDIVLEELFKLLPHVGFLHRSRNASNPFELHGPIKRLAREFIGEDVRLIISNEWEFSPYTHPTMSGIKGFVLLGLPASEAADNALLVPIVGHELGHSVWKRQKLGSKLEPKLETEVFNGMRARMSEVSVELGLVDESELRSERAVGVMEDLRDRALAHGEELFCDLCGLLLFGESYCDAFAYLLAPGLIGAQDSLYPSAQARADYLKEAGQELDVSVPIDLPSLFKLPNPDDLGSQIVAAAVNEIYEDLLSEAQDYMLSRGMWPPTIEGIEAAKTQLKLGQPVQFTSTLAEIVCAGWELRHDPNLWKSTPQWFATNYQMLTELILKSAESLEYWEQIKAASNVE